MGSHRAREERVSLERLPSHTQYYSPTGQPHHTRSTDADITTASATAPEVCSTLGKPKVRTRIMKPANVEGGCSLYQGSNPRLLLNGQQSKCIKKQPLVYTELLEQIYCVKQNDSRLEKACSRARGI